jgi:hypothetical protein
MLRRLLTEKSECGYSFLVAEAIDRTVPTVTIFLQNSYQGPILPF